MKKQILLSVAVAVTAASLAVAATMTFSDVPSSHWAANAVSWNAEAGIMTGPGDMPGMFDPAGAVNRAQLAQVNQRMYLKLHNEIEALKGDMDEDTQETEDTEETMETMEFVATLNGTSEVPAVTTDAMGTATFTLEGNMLTYVVQLTGLLEDVTAAHIHDGAVGFDGPVVHELEWVGGIDGMDTEGSMTLTAAEIEKLEDGDYYINVHTATNPDGEVRGQIMMDM